MLRGLLTAVCRFWELLLMMQPPGFFLTFFYYFAITNLIVVALVPQRLGINWLDPTVYQIGVCTGLIAGILGANYNRNITVTTQIKQKKIFLNALNKTLAEMGFEPKSELEGYTIYQKSTWAALFSGRVFVKIERNIATIMGRAVHH